MTRAALTPALAFELVCADAAARHYQLSQTAGDAILRDAHGRLAALILEQHATPRTCGEPVEPCEVDEPTVGDEPTAAGRAERFGTIREVDGGLQLVARADSDRSPASASSFPVRS